MKPRQSNGVPRRAAPSVLTFGVALLRRITGGRLASRARRLSPARATRRTTFVQELPDSPDSRLVYVLGEGAHLWAVAMVCPCGCGETLHMSLHEDARPRWHLTCHLDGTASLRPSVWRRVGCHSHFFLRSGQIQWSATGPSHRDTTSV